VAEENAEVPPREQSFPVEPAHSEDASNVPEQVDDADDDSAHAGRQAASRGDLGQDGVGGEHDDFHSNELSEDDVHKVHPTGLLILVASPESLF